ncbi:acyl-CoA N-acyltransferase [Cladorrhinum samala]|uniref:Acyl-CoA N-acyltransferase n=1 Tax=Cladorrhinum samala TaxID=585594 RepID=A0AAV9HXF0_9PEZI|nr:acyl-CoA N-acyltransferase [Cladorrhinum samala]
MASSQAPVSTATATETTTTTTVTTTSTTTSPTTTTTTNPNPTPIVTHPLFHIRPYLPSDVMPCYQAINSPLIAKYMLTTFPNPPTVPGTELWISTTAANTFSPELPVLLNYAIVSPDGSQFIGSLGFKRMLDVENRNLELGYWVGVDHWGKGIGTAAVREFVRWAFRSFPELERVEAQVFSGNGGSIKALTKAGFVHEGTRRRAAAKEGLGIFDIKMLSVIRADLAEEGEGSNPSQ